MESNEQRSMGGKTYKLRVNCKGDSEAARHFFG